MRKITLQINLPYLLAATMFLLPVLWISKTFAASTGNVSATVTPQNISVSVSDGTVAYGVLTLNSAQNTTASGVNDTQVATNDGNVTEDFNISSTDATSGTTWTLAGTAGANQYTHAFCNTGSGAPDVCDATPTWNNLANAYNTLKTAVAPAGTNRFDLRINTPTTSTDFVQKTVTVTIQAVQN
ncbi:MAG: hypothetical protein M3Q70_03515 [bacterium]|nr:hypothetical protein [bacterium]